MEPCSIYSPRTGPHLLHVPEVHWAEDIVLREGTAGRRQSPAHKTPVALGANWLHSSRPHQKVTQVTLGRARLFGGLSWATLHHCFCQTYVTGSNLPPSPQHTITTGTAVNAAQLQPRTSSPRQAVHTLVGAQYLKPKSAAHPGLAARVPDVVTTQLVT